MLFICFLIVFLIIDIFIAVKFGIYKSIILFGIFNTVLYFGLIILTYVYPLLFYLDDILTSVNLVDFHMSVYKYLAEISFNFFPGKIGIAVILSVFVDAFLVACYYLKKYGLLKVIVGVFINSFWILLLMFTNL